MKLKFTAALAATFITVLLASPSEARPRHHRTAYSYDRGEVIGGRPSGCPHAFCGCDVSLKVFGRIIPELNLADNWRRKFPRTSPSPGMVAARSGHVFYIESVNGDGTVVAYDPNSGDGKTRRHNVSLDGFTVVDPHGGIVAPQSRHSRRSTRVASYSASADYMSRSGAGQ